MTEFYGIAEEAIVTDDIGRAVEEVCLKGYTIWRSLFSPEEVADWKNRIDSVYALQEEAFGTQALESIQELDICRAPLLHDHAFIKLASHPTVLEIVRRLLGDWIILHLQNAIINRPGRKHHQSSWHRDLPYQNWVISKPLAISAIVAIDNFSPETGGTRLLPSSQKTTSAPSRAYIEANAIDAEAPAGSVIIFDSMLFHQAGSNSSQNVRRAVNHVYTAPIIKQQYDFPAALDGKLQLSPETMQLLGFTSRVPVDDKAWRQARIQRAENP